jgi:hypothetical protein
MIGEGASKLTEHQQRIGIPTKKKKHRNQIVPYKGSEDINIKVAE